MEHQAPEINEALATALLAAVSGRLEEPQLSEWRATEAKIGAVARRIAADNAELICDAQSASWVGLSCTLLATYRALRELGADQSSALAMLREALVGPFRERIKPYIQERFGIVQEAPHEAFRRIADNFKTGGESRFGRAFKYVQAVQDETRSFTNIERCLFNEFFRANSAPEVTPLLCALDNVWADELHDPKYAVRFERPTTLAQGDDACRFQFTKMQAPPAYPQQERGWMIYPERGWRRLLFVLPLYLWRLGLAKLTPSNFLLLTTTGRKSGLPRRTMLEYGYVDGGFYLSSGWGERAQWYQNALADPLVTVQTVRQGTVRGRASVVTDAEEIAALYGRTGGKSPAHSDYLASWGIEDNVQDFVAKRDRLHILRVDPAEAPTPPPMESDLKWVWPLAGAALLGLGWLTWR